ncbi:TonB-dependent receptor [Pseudomonas sp. 21LCFQ02]|uniref:TonB-dependent siderophore receptor n=1 Tax=Pseudomonas sp. 21LCFQ02 TaxID=2957505 RepID=UPI00209B782D|nr:TonB-dependent receptor [Pseudomonas sp. 21LCFQ02]MCO8167237.1 TonB-dependent receptor [Pseudomonas sp. 21LCFQ02]
MKPCLPIRTTLSIAIRVCLFGLGSACLMPSLHAVADDAATQGSVRSYDIPAGSLTEVLSRFAASAGAAISFDAGQLQGKTSNGLRGTYSVQQGFVTLLAGSNFQVVAQGNGSYVLIPRPVGVADGAIELGATSVMSSGLGSVTENSGSYTTGAVSIGKAPQTLRRTPQSVTVLTSQRLQDQNLTSLTAVLEQTPGVVVDLFDSERVNYYSRGYQIDAIQFDGATVVQGSGGGSFIQSDSALVDHIEVLRGATGMLRGSGNPSGTVNMVRKRPTREFQGSASVTAGSWDAQRYVLDVSGPLNEGGGIRGRMIAVHDDRDMFQDTRMERKNVLYGVLAADLTDSTTLTTGIEYTELDATGAWGGLPADFSGKPLDLSRSTYLGTNWNRWNRSNLQTFVELEHMFANDWSLKLSGTRTHFRLDDHGFKQTYISRASTTNPYLVNVQTTEGDGGESEQSHLGATLNGPFSLFGRQHELLLGVERIRNDSTASATNFMPNLTNVDVRTWNPSTLLPEPVINISARPVLTRTTQEGAHATWRISLADPLTAIVGARINWWDYDQSTSATGDYSVNQEVVPYAALIYDLNENFSLYGSYTEIFSPQSATDATGSVLDPVTGEAYEMGIKGEFYEGRLNTSLALFRINQVGKALDDISGPNPCPPLYPNGYCQAASGKSRSDGFEIEVSGEVLPGWQVSGGYTYTSTEFLKDTVSNTGNVLRSTDPKRMLKLFTSYRLPGAWSDLTIGGGVRAQSDIYSRSGAATATQSGYAIYSAMASYRFNDHYSVQVNANNLFDKEYYKKIGATATGYYWGEPRSLEVTLRGTF